MSRATIFFIGSSGLIFQLDNCLVMIDGILSDSNWFIKQTYSRKKEIKRQFSSFKGRRIMIFTHCHPDHYDDDSVCEYVSEGCVDTLLLPYDMKYAEKCISQESSRSEITVVSGEKCSFYFDNLSIEFIKTAHLQMDGFENAEHYSVLLSSESEKHLISSDMAPDDIIPLIDTVGTDITTFFINPILLGKRKWVKVLAELLPDTDFYIYHLPDDDMDSYGYKKFVKKNFEDYKKYIKSINLLQNQMSDIKR